MSNFYKFTLLSSLIIASLACGLITTPIDEAKNLASTAQAMASSMPLETLRAFQTSLPIGTLEALPSSIPDIGGFMNPQGTPVSEWNGIPIMPQATVGQEFSSKSYSFKVNVTVAEAQAFYNDQLKSLGWTQPFSMPGGTDISVMLFRKDSSALTVTIITVENQTLVYLLLE
jgi:hypothetical protein